MKTKAFIWFMVTLLGVTMITACDDSGYDDYSPGDSTSNNNIEVNIDSIIQKNHNFCDTIKQKDSTAAFFFDEFEEILDEYKEKKPLQPEEVEAIQYLISWASIEVKQTQSRHSELQDDKTLKDYSNFLTEKKRSLESQQKKLEKNEKELGSDSEDIVILSWVAAVGFLVLVVILIATIAHFRAKLKRVSQKQAAVSSDKEKKKDEQAATNNMEMQNGNLFLQLPQLVTEQAREIKTEISKAKGDLSRQLSQLSQQQLAPVNNGYVQGGGTYGSQLNGGNTVPPQPVVPADGTRLYAELDGTSNGGILYKAHPIRTANSLYEITLTQPGATEGSFRVLEDCGILNNVLRNRNQYLTACDFNGNDNASKIINEAPGAVSKQPNGTWLVTKKAKIKLS